MSSTSRDGAFFSTIFLISPPKNVPDLRENFVIDVPLNEKKSRLNFRTRPDADLIRLGRGLRPVSALVYERQMCVFECKL